MSHVNQEESGILRLPCNVSELRLLPPTFYSHARREKGAGARHGSSRVLRTPMYSTTKYTRPHTNIETVSIYVRE